MQEHFARMHTIGVRLAGLLSAAFGLDPLVFDNSFSEYAHALRLLHYSAEARTHYITYHAMFVGSLFF